MRNLKIILKYVLAFCFGVLISRMIDWSIIIVAFILIIWCIKTIINDIKED